MSVSAQARAVDHRPIAGRPAGRLRLGVILVVLAVALAVAVILSLAVGARSVAPAQLWEVATGASADPAIAGLLDSRTSRTVVAILVGAAMATCGCVLQGVTRNPLADAGLLGLNSGAALAVVLGIRFVGLSTPGQYVWFAIVGVVAVAALVQSLAMLAPARAQPLTMALVGASVMAAATSVMSAVIITDQDALDAFRFWQVGSVAGRDLGLVVGVAPFLIVGFLLALTSGGTLNMTALGDDLARGLGQRVLLHRGVATLGAVLLCAGAVALAGPIAFVGLLIPHVARLLVGGDYRRTLALGMLLGPLLLVVADTLGRIVTPPGEVQVGIILAVIGAPVLIYLVRTSISA